MTVSTLGPREVYYISVGLAGPYTVTFPFFNIDVYCDGSLVDPADYTITQASPGTTGSVTFDSVVTSGVRIDFVSNTRAVQEADYVDNDAFPAATHELTLDRLTLAVQDLGVRVDHSVRGPVIGEPIPPLDFQGSPDALLTTNADGDLALLPKGTFAATLEADIAAAVAAAEAAAAAAGEIGETIGEQVEAVEEIAEAAAASAAAAVVAKDAAEAAAELLEDALVSSASTRAILKDLAVAVGTAYLFEAGREGWFIWKTGDYSAQVDGDPLEGLYLESDHVAKTSGAWVRAVQDPAYPEWWGATRDGVIVKDAAITASDQTLTSATAAFTSADIGKRITVKGAGAAGVTLSTTIASINSPTSVELTAAASTTVSNAETGWGTDDQAALKAASDSKLRIFLRPGVYCVHNEWFPDNGSHVTGAGDFLKQRAGYTQAQVAPTTIRYIGAGGTNTCAVRLSRKAVGSVGTNFVPPNGDDLVGIVFRDIHVDAGGVADFGIYMYRCGNTTGISRLTATASKKVGILGLGLFSLRNCYLGAMFNEDHGIVLGTDYFDWANGEFTNFDIQIDTDVSWNGTVAVPDEEDEEDLAGSGLIVQAGRGSIIRCTAQINSGYGAVIRPLNANYSDGGMRFIPSYFEHNGPADEHGRGIFVRYDANSDGLVIEDGWLNAGGGSTLRDQHIRIVSYNGGGVATNDQGPTDKRNWLKIRNVKGGASIISNTYKYFCSELEPATGFDDRYPMVEGSFAQAFFKADASLTDTRSQQGCTVSRIATPAFRLTFDVEQPDANYHTTPQVHGTTIGHFAQVVTQTQQYVEVRAFAAGALSTPVEGTIYLNVKCERPSL